MEYLLLFISGILIGTIGVLFGGSMFLSLPLWQFFFPGMNYGQIIGNLKTGSLSRGFASSFSTWKKINLNEAITIIVPFVISSIISTATIAKVDQKYLIYAILVAIVFSELSPKLAKFINKRTRIVFSILLGFYAGFIGAGIGIMLVALLRTIFPSTSQIIFVKIQARFVETVSTIFVVFAHIYYGNIIWPIWIIWAAGTLLGGYIGGHTLKKIIHISNRGQKIYLVIVYVIALIPFGIKLLN